MEKAALLKRATETLSPFETEHIMQFLRALTVNSALGNPWIVGAFLLPRKLHPGPASVVS